MKKHTISTAIDNDIIMTKREAIFWLYNYDQTKGWRAPIDPIGTLLSESTEALNTVRTFCDSEKIFDQIEEVKGNLIPENTLKWIKKLKKEDAIYLHYNLDNFAENQESFIMSPEFKEPKLTLNQDNRIKEVDFKNSREYIIENLIFNFDHQLKGCIGSKIEHLEHLRTKLKLATEKSKPFTDFINTETSEGDNFENWLFKYEENHPFKNSAPYFPFFLTKEHDIDIFKANLKVLIEDERNKDFMKLALRLIKAAWSQKKHRDKNNGKKACSFQLTEHSIDLLDDIAGTNRRKKNEMLEILIEDAWLEMTDAKKPIRR